MLVEKLLQRVNICTLIEPSNARTRFNSISAAAHDIANTYKRRSAINQYFDQFTNIGASVLEPRSLSAN